MSYSTQGASNRQIYDCCAYAQSLQQSVDPLQYDLYFGAVENCNKCIDKKAWFKQDKQVVDIESDLRNITRPLTRCDGYKYNPNCKPGPNCISTFDPNVPRILSPSLCPIVYNNIPIQTNPGYSVPNPANICLAKNDWREASKTNTYEQYVQSNNTILGNSDSPQNVYMFMNTCSNKPLYQGGQEDVTPFMANIYDSAPVYPDNLKIPLPAYGYGLDSNGPMELNYGEQQYVNMENMQNIPGGMRLPIQATKGKMGVNPTQLFESDNESIYDSDGEYQQVN